MRLTKPDFNLDSFNHVTDVRNKIGSFKVPRDKVYFLSPEQLMRLFFTAKEEVNPGSGSSRTELTVSLSYNIVNNPKRNDKDAFYAMWNGSKAEIINVDYGANEVTIAVDDTDATAKVWYPLAVGDIQILAEAPQTIASKSAVEVFGDELIVLHALDQAKAGPSANDKITLPENFQLNIYANTPKQFDMDKSNSTIEIPYKSSTVNQWVQALGRKVGKNMTRKEAKSLVIKSWAEKVG